MIEIKTIDQVPDTEYSRDFVQGMYDRMAMSFCKYGPVAAAFPEKVDALKTLELKLQAYRETGNTEWLIDVANYALIEFLRPRHPNAHYRATDNSGDDAKHCVRQWASGEVSQRANNFTPGAGSHRYVREGD